MVRDDSHIYNDKPYDPDKECPWLKEDGIYKYYVDGILYLETSCKDGVIHGIMKVFNVGGSLDYAEEWYYGKNLSWWEW